MSIRALRYAAVAAILALTNSATAETVSFEDDFTGGTASPLWDNALGAWTAAGGAYHATVPSTPGLGPSTVNYSGLPFDLTDFTVDVDVNQISDGGIWLRTDGTNTNGILLVTGGEGGAGNPPLGGTGLYWSMAINNVWNGTIINPAWNLFDPGVSDPHLHIVVSGDTYSVYVNGSTTPATTLVTDQFASGQVALYDRSGQSFNNFQLQGTAVPEPSAVVLCLMGFALLASSRVRPLFGPR